MSVKRGEKVRISADLLLFAGGARVAGHELGDNTGKELDDRLEEAISARKNAALSPDPDDELEALIANRRRSMKENNEPKTGGFCPQCGNCVNENDRFCPKCGKALA